LDRRLGGRGGEEKNSQSLPGLEPPIIQPVAQRYTTEISWLPNFFTGMNEIWFGTLTKIKSVLSVLGIFPALVYVHKAVTAFGLHAF
jgi:hypothetical protein